MDNLHDPRHQQAKGSFLDAANRTLEAWVKLFGNSFKIGYLVSVIIGFWLLRGYCVSGDVPMPEPGTSLAIYLALVAAGCYLIMLWLVGGPLCIFAVSVAVPELKSLTDRDALEKPSLRHFRRFSRR